METFTQVTPALPPDYFQLLYKRHFRGALVRSGASLIMWLVAFFAFLFGILKTYHMAGVSASVAYLILINPPTLWVLKRITSPRLYEYFSLFINALEILGYTAIIYFLGGVEAQYATPLYAALIAYVGVVGPRRLPFIIAGLCAAMFTLMVVLEELGFIPLIRVYPDFYLPIPNQVGIIFANFGLLVVVAFIISYTSDLLKKTKSRLREQNADLEERTTQLRHSQEELQIAHERLENRVEERTAELLETNKELEVEISERKRAEIDLKKSEQKYRSHFDEVSDVIYSMDFDLKVMDVSPSVERVLGYKPEELVGNPLPDLNILAPEHFEAALSDALQVFKGERISASVYEFIARDGTRKIGEVSGSPLIQDGKIIGLISVGRDITARREAENKVKASLREKEQLLKEIHHRVKNNLQVISSLLNLQSGYSQRRPTLEMFNDSQNRIMSMAMIHEKLYQSEDLSEIDFVAYIEHLTTQMIRTYEVDSNLIKLKITGENVFLGLDASIPCGLIINEFVSNSLKHAFQEGRGGEINIDLQREDDHRYALSVGDNGVGMPEGLDFTKTQTLGLQLVNTLVDQLDGKIELDRSGGTCFRISFTG